MPNITNVTEPASSILYGDGVESWFKFRLKSLQVAILPSEPGQDFEGGEFALTDQCPRARSRALLVPPAKGDAVVFAVSH